MPKELRHQHSQVREFLVEAICPSDQAVLKPILRGKKRYSRETRKRFLHHIWSPGLAFLRAVDAVEADSFSVVIVQDL
jgi:hypothetical protein